MNVEYRRMARIDDINNRRLYNPSHPLTHRYPGLPGVREDVIG